MRHNVIYNTVKNLRNILKYRSETRKIWDKQVSQLKSDDIAIDCGANSGYYTLKLAKTGAKVYAFEPNPHVAEFIVGIADHYKNVTFLPKAVSINDGTANFYFHQRVSEDPVLWSTGASLLAYKKNIYEGSSCVVEVVDLARFIKNLNQNVKILKIDVEGVETDLMNHLLDSGTINFVDNLFLELHDHKIPELKASSEKLIERLQDLRLLNNKVHIGFLDNGLPKPPHF